MDRGRQHRLHRLVARGDCRSDRMPTFPSPVMPFSSAHFADRKAELAELRRISTLPPAERIVVISGPPGIGKTALASHFTEVEQRTASWMNLDRGHEPDFGEYFIAFEPGPDEIVIADGLDAPPAVARRFLARLDTARRSAMAIVTSRTLRIRGSNISLGPLPPGAIQDIWRSDVVDLDYNSPTTRELIQRVGGHPVVATLVGRLIRDQVVDIGLATRNLRPFSDPGLVGPDGRPIATQARERIEHDVQVVGAQMLSRLDRDPELLYKLTPRQFEEVVADLLRALGYDTEITPATRDGGKDIYAARKDALGRFLYIVECKRHAPDNPVGVGVVRSLAGVVHAERANGGIVATTSFFTRDAREFQEQLSYQLKLQDYFGIQEMLRAAKRSRGDA